MSAVDYQQKMTETLARLTAVLATLDRFVTQQNKGDVK